MHNQRVYCYSFIISMSLVISIILIATGFSQDSQIFIPDDPMQGRLIFEQKGCIQCHAIHGYGSDVAPDLGEQQFYGTFLNLASVLWNHSPQMNRKMREIHVPRPQFTQQEMSALVSFLYYLPYLGKPGDATHGKVLYSTKGCTKCHSVGGTGGSAGPKLDGLKQYLSPLYMAQAMWNHGPVMDHLMKQKGLKRPWLTGKEIVDLSAYIRQISHKGAARTKVFMSPGNPNDGQNVFVQKGCSQCHAVDGKGGTSAPDLMSVELKQSVSEIAAVMWNHGSDMWLQMQQAGMIFPKFNGKEMADLIAYLYFIAFMDETGDSENGGKIFMEKGCSSCHSTSDKSELIGPNLAKSKKLTSPIAMVQIMWNHAQIMKTRMLEKDLPWPEFKQNEMSDLYRYLQKISQKTQN